MLLFLTISIVSIPAIQTQLIQKTTDKIFFKIGHRVSIDYINIRWFDTIILRDLDLWDTNDEKMIHIDKLFLDFKLAKLLTGTSINFDQAILIGADVYMVNNTSEGQFNLNYFIERIRKEFKRKSKKPGKPFIIDEVILKNGRYKIFNLNKELITTRFDQYHFTLKDINGEFNSFVLRPGHISFDSKNLSLIDSATNLHISQLSTHFVYSPSSMVFQEMSAKIGKSELNQSMVLNYLQPSSLKYFTDSVKIVASIKRSLLHSSDLGKFIPAIKSYNQYYRLNGFLQGKVSRLNAKNLTIGFGNSSRVYGFIDTYGLPNLKETFINAQITTSNVNVLDLAPYTNADNLESLKKFGRINVKGRFSGFLNDFVSNASFKTEIGDFTTDINLKVNEHQSKETTYRGKLITNNFNLGIFVGDTSTFQMVDLNGQIKGKGFSKQDAKFDLKSKISRLGFKHYEYHNIITDATLADEFFNGTLVIEDPNLRFQADASIDLQNNKDYIQIEAQLDTAILQPLNISDKPAFFKSNMLVNINGLQLDDMTGNIYLQNTQIQYEDRFLNIDTLSLTSEKDSLGRSLKIISPLLHMHLFGDFSYTAFFSDILSTFKEYTLAIQNDSKKINDYYSSKQTSYSDYYYLDYDIHLMDFDPVIKLFLPKMHVSNNTSIIGNYTGGPTTTFEIHLSPKRLDYKNYSFRNSLLDINSTKSADTSNIYAQISILSDRQFFLKKARTEKMNMQIDWENDWIDYKCNLEQYKDDNYFKIVGNIDFLPDETRMHIDSSEFYVLNKMWRFNAEHLIVLTKKNYWIRNLVLQNQQQKINIDGFLSENPQEKLQVSIDQFEIENINPLLSKQLRGTISGLLELKNFFAEKQLDSELTLDHFSIDNFLIGDISSFTHYENEMNRFKAHLNILREGAETMDINGYLYPASNEDQMQMTANFTNFKLDMVEPFLQGLASDISGDLTGKIRITGQFSHPIIKGVGNINDGKLKFDYLNTRYSINGPIAFDNDQISINNVVIKDIDNNSGLINGKITHDGFKDLMYDINFDVTNMQVLNTTNKDNTLYYGTAYATGDIHIFGKQRNISITANAISEKNTKFYIPLDGGTEIAQQDYITFVEKKDIPGTNKQDDDEDDGWGDENDKDGVKLEGVVLDLNLDITPDAYGEIIFDVMSGDIIRGRGKGELKLQIDTKGDFKMFGQYEIEEGGYNFTMYNIINKEFSVLPKSLITWTGDPYAANLDITATYRQMASLSPLFNSTDTDINESPEIKRKYPAFVILYIKGDLRYPEIDFDIKVEDYPKNALYNGVSFETQMLAFQNKIATDEQELKRQVFSLIILKNFSKENAFNVSGSIGKSVSEFISNQISYWVTQFDENLVIDVDLGSLDKEAFNTFQFRMSYSFLDGRLRVTRDGGFTHQDNTADVVSVLGDWSVEYLLTPDGKYRVKIYNKTNYNTLNPQLQNTATTAGFSLMHTQSFDEFRELFGKARKNAIDKQNEEEDQENFPGDQRTGGK